VPSAPQNFDKILSGEIKGKELVKLNQQAFDDYNTSVLESCTNCGRTFKPEALERHKKGCKEDKPMLKNKGPGYTSRMKAKVSYPKLKKTEADPKHVEDSCDNDNVRDQEADECPSPSVIRKETVILSKSVDYPDELESISTTTNSAVEEPVKKSTSLSRKDTIVIQRHNDNSNNELRSASQIEEAKIPVKSLPPRPVPGQSEAGKHPRATQDQSKSLSKPISSNKSHGHGNIKTNTPTLKNSKLLPLSSNRTTSPNPDPVQKAEYSNQTPQEILPKSPSSKTLPPCVPSKQDVIYLVETEAIFDDKEHRKAILDLVTNYAKNVHKEQILRILDHAIFDDVSQLEEVVTILGDFVAAKLNNNNNC